MDWTRVSEAKMQSSGRVMEEGGGAVECVLICMTR